jgi:hypothetical protein
MGSREGSTAATAAAAQSPNQGLKGPCEASRSVDYSGSAPVIVKCERTGRWRPMGLMPFGTVLCDDCYVTILLRRQEARDEP